MKGDARDFDVANHNASCEVLASWNGVSVLVLFIPIDKESVKTRFETIDARCLFENPYKFSSAVVDSKTYGSFNRRGYEHQLVTACFLILAVQREGQQKQDDRNRNRPPTQTIRHKLSSSDRGKYYLSIHNFPETRRQPCRLSTDHKGARTAGCDLSTFWRHSGARFRFSSRTPSHSIVQAVVRVPSG